jgi:hypothetical protein
MDLSNLVLESEEVLLSEFNIKPEKSIYQVHPNNEWFEFVKKTSSHPDSHGIYLPRSLSAYLKESSEFLPVNLMHEYFGHGLFCEHAITGQRIVSLEHSLAETEKEMLNLTELPDLSHFQIDKTNPYFQRYKSQREDLQQFFSQNVYNYEGFAIWLEHFLSKATNNENLFEQKMDELVHPDYRKLFEKFQSFSEQNGNFALIAQLGFPKYYDDVTIIDTLKRIYKKDFESINLAILYGSQEPYSDIDLLVVSDKINSGYNHWLDIYARTQEDFEKDLSNFSIAVTDPLFSGRTIVGGSGHQEQLKQRVLNQPITQEAIQYNMQQSEEQGRIALMYPEGSKERSIAVSYQQSFRKNAEELQKGNKILTLR